MSKNKLKFLSDEFDGIICAVDEVGYGACFGPIVSCALIMPINAKSLFVDLKDSKKISNKKRCVFYNQIALHCKFSLGFASNNEIDSINVRNANIMCCVRAIANLDYDFDKCFIDGNMNFDMNNYFSIVRGDSNYIEIAAASIIAKISRDYLMYLYSYKYPYYHLDRNKGYCTKTHFDSIRKNGLSPLHRRSFLKKI